MKHIAIIPARSGSKGLTDKNIKNLNGKPMMAYTIEAAMRSGIFDCVHVSTDSGAYARIAKEYGADVPFLRDPVFAGDGASTWDALRSVLFHYKENGREFELVTLLQPTSPLRDAEDIRSAYRLFLEKDADAVIGVCQVEHPLSICNALGENGSMHGFLDSNQVGARQGQAKHYRINGAIYMQYVHMLVQKENLYNEKSYAFIMSKEHSIDVDDLFDFQMAEAALKNFERSKEDAE